MSDDIEKRKRRLMECEEVLASHSRHVFEAGRIIREIRDDKLYLEAGFKTFEEYCKTRWEFTVRHAQRLMVAAEIREKLPEFPESDRKGRIWKETYVRELDRLPNTARIITVAKKVIEAVEKNGTKLTGHMVRKVVDKELGIKRARAAPSPKIDLAEAMRRWTGTLEADAEILEKAPDDALEIIAEEKPYIVKDFITVLERILSRMENFRRPHAKRR